MILFLDFDGVLHPNICSETEPLLCRRQLLENLLREHTHVEVVISSTWRNNRSLPQLQAFFSVDIIDRIIGVTPRWNNVQDDASFGTYVRQAEIEGWLRESGRPWENWIALDDQAHLFRPFLKNLVLTKPEIGLTKEICTVLSEKLAAA